MAAPVPGCPVQSAWSARSDRCSSASSRTVEPSRGEPSSRALLRGCAPISTSAAQALGWAMCFFPLTSRLPGYQALPRFARSLGKPNLLTVFPGDASCPSSQFTEGVDLPSAATEDGEAHGSAMFKLRERDGLHEPYLCASAAHWRLLPTCNCRVATQRKHLQNSSHARIAREARSATL